VVPASAIWTHDNFPTSISGDGIDPLDSIAVLSLPALRLPADESASSSEEAG
jgi:hypothetical protein